jgi:PIN domain nuclease of toxin-antitoxin system
MVEYVADTHALIWYLSGSERLGDEARALFDSAIAGEIRVLIPAIVVAELIMFAEKHKTIKPDNIISELRSRSNFQLLALLPETAAKIQDFRTLPDIHDRLIVAETVLQGATLITYDKAITDSGLVNVIW